MRTLLPIGLLTAFSLVLASFIAPKGYTPFETALAEKKIEIVILPTGGHSGDCIQLQVKNLTKTSLSLGMAPGTTFVPENEEEQTLVTAQEELLVLEKGEQKTFNVSAYCTEAHDNCPSSGSKFSLSKTKNASLTKLTHYLDSLNGLNEGVIQQAIWCVTDSQSVSSVYTEDPKVSKALRAYLCKLTGQKDTWYTTRRDVSVDENRRIVSVAKEVKGELSFQTTVPVEMQGVVIDSTGKEVYKNPNITRCPAGKIKFDFKLRVEGWEPGQYYVVYTNNGQEILRQPFTI